MSGADRLREWEGCCNARDVGGYPAAGRRRTRRGALLRSATMCQLTPRGRAQVLADGVATVVDLRSAYEIEAEPNPYAAAADGSGPLYLNLPLFDYDDQATMARLRGLRSLGDDYCIILDGFRRLIGRVAAAIAAAPEGGVLVHCHAGKDRTGIVVAVLLALVGVPPEVIVADYAESERHLWPDWQRRLRLDPSLAGRLGPPRSPPEAMARLLDCLEREHGGAAAYLRSAGLDDAEIERLRERLVE